MSPPAPHHRQLKRLQRDISSNIHVSSNNHRSQLPNGEAIRESIQQFSRPFNPGPQRARRGGGRTRDRHWHSSLNLPTRAINYDLAESFMDHSTNPLSSNLYQTHFKHSSKRWPDGRFKNYREKQNKLDGNILEIVCTRTFEVIKRRKQMLEVDQNESNGQSINPTSLLAIMDPVVQGEKRKQVDQQASIYENLFGERRIPRISSTTQPKKTNSTPSASISLLDEPPSTTPQ